ncbi:MAG: hypothetical protein HC880_02520 [Bacteroidia bacterium]|nr:hypothetical protein [Bacteroidia bacterium]
MPTNSTNWPLPENATQSLVVSSHRVCLISLFWLLLSSGVQAQFSPSNLLQSPSKKWTSLQFGPDQRLYASDQFGKIYAFTVNRLGKNQYQALKTEEISLVEIIAQRQDQDGAIVSPRQQNGREVTGLLVTGTPTQPVLYVSSSDVRIGGLKGDVNLDTNSGVISRLTWKHNQAPNETDFSQSPSDLRWDKVDLVRGLPRSEENHATNGMQLASVNGKNYLFVCSGGHNNGGGPGRNFTKITEYALSAAILSIDLDALATLEQAIKANNGSELLKDADGKYLYNLPTVDDPTRPNVANPDFGIVPGAPPLMDVNDPWGGNDGLNQARIIANGPVQIFSPGYRNSYDLVITQSQRMYVTDNGANGGWGGFPENEGPALNGQSAVTNNYWVIDGKEPGGDVPYNSQIINNKDHLHLVKGGAANTLNNYSWGSYYAGHPCPIRANPTGAGLYTHFGSNTDNNGVFRTKKFGSEENDPAQALPADWPPVPPTLANPVEGDFRNPGVEDDALLTWTNNTNGITEYTASALQGIYKGNLLAVNNKGHIHRVALHPDGSLKQFTPAFLNLNAYLLDITALGDDGPFPGTIWLAVYNNSIQVLEPDDYEQPITITCLKPSDKNYDPTADYDLDRYTNDDETLNGTDPCGSGQFPPDFDRDFVSDRKDQDDDNDGILDYSDIFPIDSTNQLGITLPVLYDLFNSTGFGFYQLGFTGLMTNRNPNDDYLNWLDQPGQNPPPDDLYGGAPGLVTIYVTDGDARTNNQEKLFNLA